MGSTDAAVQPEARSPGISELTDLYRSWGLVELLGETVARIPPQWLQILNIARNLLDGRTMPGVTLPAEIARFVERDTEVVYERRKVSRKVARQAEELPEEPDVRPIESFSEFPQILVSQRMWQFIDAELFFYRIYAHDVLVKEKEERPPRVEDEEEVIEELVPVARPQRRRQRVLVLRDTSSSMRDANKGIFAKAIVLAYLIKAHEEGAEVGDRSFANTVHPRLRASTREEFAAIAQRILKEGYYGTTGLAAALDITMSEIRREELGLDPNARAKTEILLVSDCENPVELPMLPPGVVINTLHLEGGREGLMLRDYQSRLREIQEVSRLFVRVDTSRLQVPDAGREAWLILEEHSAVRREMERLAAMQGEADPTLAERARQAERLATLYERLTRGTKLHGDVGLRLGGAHLGEHLPVGELIQLLWRRLMATAARMRVRRHAEEEDRPTRGSRPSTSSGMVFRPKG